MTPLLPEPGCSHDVKALFLTYLDFYRETVVAKLTGVSESDLRASRLPSGWSPLELMKHLVFMERRWLVWGFLGEAVSDPWGDESAGVWHVEAADQLDRLVAALRQGGARTREIAAGVELSTLAQTGGRFPEDAEPPSLAAILFHVLQEYARHVGHLDVARELIDGRVGE